MGHSFSILNNSTRKGSALMWVMIMGLATGIGIFAIYNFLPQLSREQIKSEQLLQLKLALSGSVDFLRASIEKKVCFNNLWLQDSNCDLQNDPLNRASERLFLGDESIRFYQVRLNQNLQPLNIIEGELTLDQIKQTSQEHPLRIIVAGIDNSSGVRGFRFKIERINNAFTGYPTTGHEVQIRIRSTLLTDSTFTRLLGREEFFAESTLVLFPRELASFALITARNLRLDGTTQTLAAGDIKFPTLSAAPATQGLVFKSSIYVHGDLVLPHYDSPQYTPIKFLAPVVLGIGRLMAPKDIMSNELIPFTPRSGGGSEDRYFNSHPKFGGLNKGVRIDGEMDKGLPCLFNITSPRGEACQSAGASSALLSQRAFCIEQINFRNDLSQTRNTELVVKANNVVSSPSSLNFDLLLGATNNNSFISLGQNQALPPSTQNLSDATIRPINVTYSETDRPTAKIIIEKKTGPNKELASFDLVLNKEIQLEFDYPTTSGLGNSALTLKLEKSKINSTEQNHMMSLKTSLSGRESFDTTFNDVQIKIKTYEVGDGADGNSMRDTNTSLVKENGFEKTIPLNGVAQNNLSTWQSSVGKSEQLTPLTGNSLSFRNNLISAENYFTQNIQGDIAACEETSIAGSETALMGDFPGQAANSWHFRSVSANNSPNVDISFTSNTSNTDSFQIYSMARNCSIGANVNFFAGFLTCDNFIISQRTNPLTIVGTVIAKELSIHPSALNAGINWLSIYHPQGLALLRANNVLSSAENCKSYDRHLASRIPIWHPKPSISKIAADRRCFTTFIRERAQPFTWTRIDPDCVLVGNSTQTVCKKNYRNFIFKEISRKENL